MQVQSRTKKIIKSGTILILAIIVIIGISAGLGAIGLPFWPFSLFPFYNSIDAYEQEYYNQIAPHYTSKALKPPHAALIRNTCPNTRILRE